MVARSSRYRDTRAFDPPEGGGEAPFAGTRPRDIGTPRGVLEHTLVAGDRLDLLALHYYADPHRWWRILDANPSIFDAGTIGIDETLVGTVILIPAAEDGAP